MCEFRWQCLYLPGQCNVVRALAVHGKAMSVTLLSFADFLEPSLSVAGS